MGGDKIVLLDGAGANGGGAATNGLLSMIPGMFANLIGGNKMDPNLVAALMNGRNNQDGFGGANGWWLWIIVLFWLWGGRGFGNGFGNGGDCCANGLPAQLNNDYGRELLMQAIQGNRSAIDQIASALNCSTTQLQNAICNVQGAIDKVAGQVEYEFDNTNDLNHIIFKGNCREPFSFSRVLVEELIKTFETIRDRYSDNYELKVYLYNCIIQLSVNPKDPSESFFGVYDRDEMKLIYGIKISILKGMFGI